MARAVRSNTLRALRHRNFQLFFAGQLISLIGTWMQTVAQSWLVYRLSGSPTLLGLASFTGQIPIFILLPVVGYVVDWMFCYRVGGAAGAAGGGRARGGAGGAGAGRVRI